VRHHHVQVAMPVGGEDEARRFWHDTLGLTEVPKPEPMAARGGCWFRAYDDDGAVVVEIHVGREDPFVPARKAHPAMLVPSIAELERLGAAIEAGGFEVVWTDRRTFPGYERFHCFDGFGNRVEVLAAA
jgi:catechol 2,3-dioxygenase-like lactoylglutathione lyase family enzyme